MYLGDNMLQQGLAEFVERFEADRARRGDLPLGSEQRPPGAQILLAQVDDPRSFGVAEIDAPRARSCAWSRSRSDPPSDLALVGVYLFDAAHPRGGARPSSPRPGASSRSPTPSSG